MTDHTERLTSVEHWGARGDVIEHGRPVDQQCWFRGQAHLLAPLMKRRAYRSVVEVGAYPGQILDWLCRICDLKATGIEFVPAQANALRRTFPSIEILDGDFLSDGCVSSGRTWDVVCSFGLVEHWTDLSIPIRRKMSMVAPGGCCVVGIPLHAGVYGTILRTVDPALHACHGRYSLEALRATVEAVGGAEWRVDVCTAVEGVGFWNCGLVEWIGRQPAAARWLATKAIGAWHRTITKLPAPAMLRPNGLLIATRVGGA